MRILYITEASSAGTGRHVIDLASGLSENGDDVSVIYGSRRLDARFRDAVESPGKVDYHSCEISHVPTASDLRTLRFIRQLIKENGPYDVIHGHSTKGGLLARLMSNIAPVIYTPHCPYTMRTDARRMAVKLAGWLELRLSRRSDAIIAVSRAEEHHLKSLGIDNERIHQIPNGAELGELSPREAARSTFGIDPNELVFGFIGRLSPQKNPELLIEGFAQYARQSSIGKLLLVGSGELESDCRALASELKIADRIIWAGFQHAEEVLTAFDALIMPSRYEGAPYVLIEALGAGLPIVATNVAGVQEAIEDGTNGLVVPQDDAARLAECLLLLANHPDRRSEMQRASLARYSQFRVADMVSRTRQVYNLAVEARRARNKHARLAS